MRTDEGAALPCVGTPEYPDVLYSRVPLGNADEEGAVLAHACRDVPERHRLPVRTDRPCNTLIIADYNAATGIIRNCKADSTHRLPVRADRPCNTLYLRVMTVQPA